MNLPIRPTSQASLLPPTGGLFWASVAAWGAKGGGTVEVFAYRADEVLAGTLYPAGSESRLIERHLTLIYRGDEYGIFSPRLYGTFRMGGVLALEEKREESDFQDQQKEDYCCDEEDGTMTVAE